MHYHLIGIGGSSLAGIARILEQEGHDVTGTDERTTGHGAQHLAPTVQVVIYSEAITPASAGYGELEAARARGLKTLRRIEFIAERMANHTGIAIAGAHGKSTTTALIGWALTELKADPTVFIGADFPPFGGSARSGHGQFVVAEACEWQQQFLALRPSVAVVTTIDDEHLDTYPAGRPAIIQAFRQFCESVGTEGFVVANRDDASVRLAFEGLAVRVIWVGRDAASQYQLRTVEPTATGELGVGLTEPTGFSRYLVSPLVGVHHAVNIAAAWAVTAELGLPAEPSLEAITSYPGLKRRFERYRDDATLTVVDDYAHHPTEIAATLQAVRVRYPKRRLVAAFQPHTSQRTTDSFAAFIDALALADWVVVAETYEPGGRVHQANARTSDDLVRALKARGVSAEYGGSLPDTEARLRAGLRAQDVVLLLGATSIWTLARGLAEVAL